MKFKTWLLTEDIASDSEAFGDVLYPSTAADYPYAVSDPTEFWWLQWRWEMDKDKIGRPFHNIDEKEFRSRKYVAIQSTELPDSEKEWTHKPSKDSTQSVHTHNSLIMKKIGKNSKEQKKLPDNIYLSIDGRLEQHFGDKDQNKWPEAAPDTDWTNYKSKR